MSCRYCNDYCYRCYVGGKVYRREALVRKAEQDPEFYKNNKEELDKAQKEGRIR